MIGNECCWPGCDNRVPESETDRVCAEFRENNPDNDFTQCSQCKDLGMPCMTSFCETHSEMLAKVDLLLQNSGGNERDCFIAFIRSIAHDHAKIKDALITLRKGVEDEIAKSYGAGVTYSSTMVQ
jgi:hypothetical protein